MKNILITGGAGFIGSNLAEFLYKKKFNIFIVDDLSIGKRENLSNNKIKFYKTNLTKINIVTAVQIII